MSSSDPDPVRVLHVDDEPDFAELAATFLEREREAFEVSTARSADDGLAILADAADVDCIVSDYDMPGTSGLEFLETVREEYPDLPFVLFTGRGSEEIASRAISAGVTDYLNKGSGTDQYTVLANRIENAVSQYRTERDLRRSTERIRKLYGGITDAIFVLDSEWRFTHLNERAEELLQRSERELVGENVWEVFSAAVDTTFQQQYERTMDERVAVSFEEFYPPLDTWFEVRAVPTGEGLTAHFRDITEKKERERTIRRQNERLRTIVENAPVVLFALDEEGVFRFSEGQGLSDVGIEPGELLGQSAFDVWGGTSIVEHVQRALEGETLHATEEVGDRVFETWYQPVDDREDTESRTIGVAIDVTERAERERRFDAVFDDSSQLVALLRPDGTIAEINDTAVRCIGDD
jgi:PAS domain S-box-containing protein